MARKNKALLALARRKAEAKANMERISGDLRAAEARLDEIHLLELELERGVAVKVRKPSKAHNLAVKIGVAATKAAFDKMRAAADVVDQHATPT
jgi:hypothetical protein